MVFIFTRIISATGELVKRESEKTFTRLTVSTANEPPAKQNPEKISRKQTPANKGQTRANEQNGQSRQSLPLKKHRRLAYSLSTGMDTETVRAVQLSEAGESTRTAQVADRPGPGSSGTKGSGTRLTPKRTAFIREYRKSGDRYQAYKAAGYKTAEQGADTKYLSQNVYRVLNAPIVQTELARLAKADEERDNATRDLKVELIREEHWSLHRVALKEGDLTNATRNLEALGRTIGAYSDAVTLDLGSAREYSDRERAEAKRVAALLVTTKALPAPESDEADSAGAETVAGENVDPGASEEADDGS